MMTFHIPLPGSLYRSFLLISPLLCSLPPHVPLVKGEVPWYKARGKIKVKYYNSGFALFLLIDTKPFNNLTQTNKKDMVCCKVEFGAWVKASGDSFSLRSLGSGT